jgi:hypothetical protein
MTAPTEQDRPALTPRQRALLDQLDRLAEERFAANPRLREVVAARKRAEQEADRQAAEAQEGTPTGERG